MRGLVALIVAAALVAAPAAGSAVSGLRGVVMRGPISPVCLEDEPCERPEAGVVLQFTQRGRAPVRVTTRRDGGYAVSLRPGLYAVTTVPVWRRGEGLTPRAVRVPSGRVARVDFHLDTGLQ